MERTPGWRGRADAWFKLLGAIVFGYLVLGQIVVLLRQFSAAATIFVGALLLAYFVLPAIAWLRRRFPLWAAIAMVYGAGTLVLAAVAYLVVPPFAAQFTTLVQSLPQIQGIVERFFADPHNPIVSRLPAFMQNWLEKMPGYIAEEFQHNAVTYSSNLVTALGALTSFGVLLIAIPVVSLYLIAEASRIRGFVLDRMPSRVRRTTSDIIGDVDSVLGGFVRGQLIVAFTVGVLATIALLILHVPYALVIGAWAGIADVVPYVGPFAGGVPAGIAAVVYQGWGGLLGVGIAFFVINQIEGQLLVPRIVSSTVRVTPLGVIFALLISAQLFGFVGLVAAVPLAGLVRIAIVRAFPVRVDPSRPAPPTH